MWDYFKPENAKWYQWNLDGASVHLRKNGDEWRSVFSQVRFQDLRSNASGPVLGEPPEGTVPLFSVASGHNVALRPHFGVQPYLIIARNDVRILGGAEARFDVALPVLVRFELENGDSLGEGMPFALSNTWFGDKTSGSLCWSIPTELDPRCSGEQDLYPNSSAKYKSLLRCEIIVRNDSKIPLDLKRLAIYTDMLNIYEESGALVTDCVHVDGLSDGGLRMRVVEASTNSIPLRRLLTAAQVGQRELLVRRGVNFLRSVTGL